MTQKTKKNIIVCGCHSQKLKNDNEFIDGSIQYYCPVNGEPIENVYYK